MATYNPTVFNFSIKNVSGNEINVNILTLTGEDPREDVYFMMKGDNLSSCEEDNLIKKIESNEYVESSQLNESGILLVDFLLNFDDIDSSYNEIIEQAKIQLEKDEKFISGCETKFINLTPHTVNIFNAEGLEIMTVPSTGVARSTERRKDIAPILGVDIAEIEYGDVVNLPEPEEGVYYIVSIITADQIYIHTGRHEDILITGTPIRNASGAIIGCTGLSKVKREKKIYGYTITGWGESSAQDACVFEATESELEKMIDESCPEEKGWRITRKYEIGKWLDLYNRYDEDED